MYIYLYIYIYLKYIHIYIYYVFVIKYPYGIFIFLYIYILYVDMIYILGMYDVHILYGSEHLLRRYGWIHMGIVYRL